MNMLFHPAHIAIGGMFVFFLFTLHRTRSRGHRTGFVDDEHNVRLRRRLRYALALGCQGNVKGIGIARNGRSRFRQANAALGNLCRVR